MYRIDDPTAVTSLPTPEAAGTEGFFTEGNPATGTPATRVRGSWMNMLQEELRAVVVAGGLTPNKTVLTQVRDAIKAMLSGQASGRLLHVWVYARVGGVQQVSLDGAAFTSTGAGAFTPASSLTTSVIAAVQGAGGGGAGTPAAAGSQVSIAPGGAAGAYAQSRITSGFSGVTVTVGAGGSAGASGGGTGGAGGTSSFGALLSAVGGQGAIGGASGVVPFLQAGPSGATAPTTGNIVNAAGVPGGDAVALVITNFASGSGAPSQFGAGGVRVVSSSQPGIAPASTSYGAGGSGGASGGSAQAGGAGAGGVVIVYEYA